MTAAAVLTRLREAGLTVTADADDLVVRPASRLTPELVSLARAYKPELLVLLAPDSWTTACCALIPPGVCHDCGGPAPRDGMHRCRSCGDCRRDPNLELVYRDQRRR
jgi:hypothetical protein